MNADLQLPEPSLLLQLPAEEQAALVVAAMHRTWNEVNGNKSLTGRRRFFVAWRAWVAAAETAESGDPEAYEAARRGLDFLETFTHSVEARRN